MDQRVSGWRHRGSDSEEGASVGSKLKQRSEEEGCVAVGDSEAKAVVPSSVGRHAKRVGAGSGSGKGGARMDLLEQIQVRLRLLEEDTGIMKKAVFGFAEERNMLMSEIAQQFSIVKGHLNPAKIGDGALGLASILDPRKECPIEPMTRGRNIRVLVPTHKPRASKPKIWRS